jgi:hypothetical protein
MEEAAAVGPKRVNEPHWVISVAAKVAAERVLLGQSTRLGFVDG